MKHKQRIVRIENGAGGSDYTSEKRARKYVAEGRAEWTKSGGIRFREASAVHRDVVRMANEMRDGAMASRRMIQNLPVVGNIAVLTVRKRRAA